METAGVFKVGLKRKVLSTLEITCNRYECHSKRLAGLTKPLQSPRLKTNESILDVLAGYFTALALRGGWITPFPNLDLSFNNFSHVTAEVGPVGSKATTVYRVGHGAL